MNSEIDGTCTRLHRHALNINWRQHLTNVDLCGDLPKISSVTQQRRIRPAGHCCRSVETVANLILWKPKYGYRNPVDLNLTMSPSSRKIPAILTKISAQPCQTESYGESMRIRVRPVDDDDYIKGTKRRRRMSF